MKGTSFCPNCGAPTTPLTEICPGCGARVAGKSGHTWKPTAAGVLDLVAGGIGVVGGVGLMSFPDYEEDVYIGLVFFSLV